MSRFIDENIQDIRDIEKSIKKQKQDLGVASVGSVASGLGGIGARAVTRIGPVSKTNIEMSRQMLREAPDVPVGRLLAKKPHPGIVARFVGQRGIIRKYPKLHALARANMTAPLLAAALGVAYIRPSDQVSEIGGKYIAPALAIVALPVTAFEVSSVVKGVKRLRQFGMPTGKFVAQALRAGMFGAAAPIALVGSALALRAGMKKQATYKTRTIENLEKIVERVGKYRQNTEIAEIAIKGMHPVASAERVKKLIPVIKRREILDNLQNKAVGEFWQKHHKRMNYGQ